MIRMSFQGQRVVVAVVMVLVGTLLPAHSGHAQNSARISGVVTQR